MPIARHFTELIIWQLGDEVRQQVVALTKTRPFAADLKLRSQLDDAADSVCRNIAEGFACKTDKEFARFVRIGRRSLNEVQDCFRSALLKRYVTGSERVSGISCVGHSMRSSYAPQIERQDLRDAAGARPV